MNILKNIKFILLFQFLVFSVYGQDESLSSFINSRVVNEEGVVQHITFKDSEKPNFKNGSNVLKQFLETSDSITFIKLESKIDRIGMTHEKYQQYYNGIPVEFGIYIVHSKNQRLLSINGEFYPIKEISTTPFISALDAVSKAKQHVNAEKYIEESDIYYYENMDYNGPKPTLVIFPKLEGVSETNRLAYKLDIYAEKPLYRADVYLDAQTGELIFENSKIQHINVPATGATLYNGSQNFTAELAGGIYRLRQTTNGNGIQTFDATNGNYANAVDVTSSTTNFASNQDAVQVHWGTEQTYKYYFDNHGRNSFDDNGTIIKSYVNYGAASYPDAFWNGSVMSYHGASTPGFVNEFVAIDIVGHEITHGVVQHSAGLIYSYQSGALNESFADIFGEMVENQALVTNDWLGAAAVYVNPGGFSRSLSNPKLKNDPDTYLGQYWHTSSSDSFGAHTNSGVQNKWFYLLSEGGTGTNDNNDSYSVTGIGKIGAAEIAYRNLTVYLTPASNFFDARAGAIQSAIDLYGAGTATVIATTAAWNAVGVGPSSSDTIPPTIPLNLVGSNFTQYNIDLTWDASTDNIGVMGYNIYMEGSIIGTTTSQNYSNGNLPNLPLNTVYEFTVSAFDAAGNNSGLSNVVSVWVDTIEPSDPTNLMSSNTTQTTTDLSWDASSDNFSVAGYNIYKDNTLLTTVASAIYSVTSLTPNTTYNFKVTAIDDSGNESGIIASSNAVTVTTLAPCVDDSNLTLTIALDFNPEEFSWDIKDATNTVIASGGNYLPSQAHTTVVYNFIFGPGSYTLNMHDTYPDGLIPPGGYTLESNVVIASDYTYGPFIPTVTHQFCINNGIVLANPSFELDNAVKIITIDNGIEVVTDNSIRLQNYTIYSMTGSKVTIGNESEIPTGFLSSGIYILKLDFDKGIVVKKVLVN